ncbi:MAG: M23 family metallopeptidase [Novosphingobium sp.]|nr:M23 family metallopeptidase [Novosphingobium sp.]
MTEAEVPQPPAQRLRANLLRLRARIERQLDTIDLAPDLAQDIGSGRWFRGIGTMLGLSMIAVSFWPDFTQVEAATAMKLDHSVRDEFRSQMIMPLALGADSGRRMGATAMVVPLRSAPERPMIQLVATLGQGDSLERMLERAGAGQGDISRVAALIGNTLALSEIEPGTQFDITLGKRVSQDQPRPLDRIDFRARFDLEVTVERRNGQLTLTRRPIMVDGTPLRIRGMVGNSLYRSARAAGAPLHAIQQYLRAIDDHISLENDVLPSDQFDIIIAYKRSAKGERLAGELLYAGLDRGSKPKLQLLRWGKDGQFYEATGVGRQRPSLISPVAGRLTSGFGMRRHPILGYRRMHSGIDYAASYGTPIYAVSDGIVTFAGRHGGHGNYVRIAHGGANGTGYAHMSRIAVSSGSRVRAGQVIGYVGSTGLSTGPHLHFEVYRNGRAVDPASVRFLARPQIDGEELARFKAELARLRSVEPGAALRDIAPVAQEPAEPRREIDRLASRRAVVAPAPERKNAAHVAYQAISGGVRN